MNKLLLTSTALLALSSSSAYADSFYLGIGNPAPAYVVEPPPAYVVEPTAVPYGYYHTHAYYERHHDYNWDYWHGRKGHPDDRHDHWSHNR